MSTISANQHTITIPDELKKTVLHVFKNNEYIVIANKLNNNVQQTIEEWKQYNYGLLDDKEIIYNDLNKVFTWESDIDIFQLYEKTINNDYIKSMDTESVNFLLFSNNKGTIISDDISTKNLSIEPLVDDYNGITMIGYKQFILSRS